MKIKCKKILAFFLTLLIVLSINNMVFASKFDGAIDDFGGEDNPEGSGLVKNIVETVLTLVRIFAAGVAIIVITVMGTKYVTAAATEKAEIKGKLINFVIGIILVVAATSIVKMAIDISKDLN